MMHEGTLAELQAATGLATLSEMFLGGLTRRELTEAGAA
jgi:hypothetical protein